MKYHINSKGVPAPCRAQKGNCPFGDTDSHYDSKEEAQKAADKEMAGEFGLMGIEKKEEKPLTKEVKMTLLRDIVTSEVIRTDARNYFKSTNDKNSYNKFQNSPEIFSKMNDLIDPKNTDLSDEEVRDSVRQTIADGYSHSEESKERVEAAVDNIMLMRSILRKTDDELELRNKMEDHHIEKGYNEVIGDRKPLKKITDDQLYQAKQMAAYYMASKKIKSKEDSFKSFVKFSSMFGVRIEKKHYTAETKEIAHKLAKEYHENKSLNHALSYGKENLQRVGDKVEGQVERFFNQDTIR